MTAAIETFGLTKTFGHTRAVGSEEAEHLPGPDPQVNGAGKTTTIRMLLALHRPTSGRATVLGLEPAADSVAIHRRAGCLPGELARMSCSRRTPVTRSSGVSPTLPVTT